MSSPGYRGLHGPIGTLDDFAYRYPEAVAFSGGHELPHLMVPQVAGTERELQSGEEPGFSVCIAPSPTHPADREMRGSEDTASGTVLQRLMQEHLRCGGQPGDGSSLMSAQQQPLSLPLGGHVSAPLQSHPSAAGAATSEEPLQDELQMSHQSARQEPQGQEHQVDSASMEKQGVRVAAPPQLLGQQNDEELPSYEEAKAQSQFYRSQPPPPQPFSISTGYYLSGGVSAAPAPPVSPVGRASVSRSGAAPPHRDEALKELKQGHVRSLSERIMQMSLERNGAKQQPPTSGCSSLPPQPSSSCRAPKSSPPPFLSSVAQAKGGPDPRGPPPEYPFRLRQTPSPAAKVVPAPSPVDQGLVFGDPHSIVELPKCFPNPQPTKTEITYVRYPSPPEYFTRQFPVSLSLQQHSPMSSQASSLSGAGAPPRAPLLSPPPPPPLLPPPLAHQPPGDAFAIVARAQQMVEILSEENRALRQELQAYCEKAFKLQRFEAEIQKISEDYEELVKSSAKRESLDKAMKNKLEGEIRRLHDFNRDLRDRLETANRQLASRDLEAHEGSWPLGLHLSQSRESVKEREKLELRKKRVYVDKVEKLQHALSQLQATCEKREQMERRLRTRLERELESLRAQQRHGGLAPNAPASDYNPPALMELLREKEERILALEADMTKWEQKYLEESAMRHFTMDAAATAAAQRDATIINHSRHGSYSDSSLDARIWQEEEEEEEILQANRRCQDMEQRIKNLHAQIIEKDAMIKVLQQRSRKEQGKAEPTPLRPARSVPSISVATSLHLRQTSQTGGSIPEERRDERGWKGSASECHRTACALLSVGSTMVSDQGLGGRVSRSVPPGVLLGKDPPETVPPTATSSLPATPLLSAHCKTGSRDSCTQTDRSPEPPRAIAGRPRLSNTPSSSPVLRHTLARGGAERTESPTAAMRSTDVRHGSHRRDLPDADVVEILI
ncbi:angiomotin-like protein 1-like [Scleropages formosus]|uniref:Angiomotin-like protein 1-like n=1 Tax=Scleropages formosus TaxID=113540 RepID=A0A0P7TIK8_SCLFO|nr:angiomotin-like protein 1-like [Scleropages formosus]